MAMNRREALRTIGMGAAVGVVAGGTVYAVTPTSAGAPDPVHALIAAHKATYARLNEVDDDDPTWDAVSDADWLAWDALCDCKPTTVAGIAAMALYVGSHSERADLHIDLGPAIAMASIAQAAAALPLESR